MKYVLYLERSSFFVKIVKKIIEPRGYEVLNARETEEAFSILQSKDISLIISGTEMKNSRGTDFIEKLSESEFSSVPVIILTSRDSLSLRERFFSLGVADYILKENITARRLQVYFDTLIGQNKLLDQIRTVPIAVLDDSRFGLKVIKNIFKLNRIHDVTYFTTPEVLLEQVERFNIFIVDLVLPKISGEEVIMRIRETSKESIIIVVSSITSIKSVTQALMYGADDYITKPFDNSIFMARLKSNARTFFLYHELKLLAVTDGLTGLYNHKYIYDFVVQKAAESKNSEKTFCVMLFDIDHFKKVNDTYGHPVGDMVLKAVSGAFREVFPENAVIGRYGGEEFLVVFPDTILSHAVDSARRVLKYIEASTYRDYEKLHVTISGGVAEYHGETAAEIIQKADALLYYSKRNGRNQITF